jgi:hypothetical protein
VQYFRARLPLRLKPEVRLPESHMALFIETRAGKVSSRLTLCLDFEKMCQRHDIRQHGCQGLPLCIIPMTAQATSLARTFWDLPAMLHYDCCCDCFGASSCDSRILDILWSIGVDDVGISAMLKAGEAAVKHHYEQEHKNRQAEH